MRPSAWIGLLASLQFSLADPVLRPRDYDNREYYALKLSTDASPEALAGHLGLSFEGPIGELDHHYLFSGPKRDADVVAEYRRRRKAKRSGGSGDPILFAQKQKVKRLEKRSIPPRPRAHQIKPRFVPDDKLLVQLKGIAESLKITDPIFHEQWHLFNTVDKEHDVNVTGLWQQGITGFNTTVSIVDDGLDMYSEDLKANYVRTLLCCSATTC